MTFSDHDLLFAAVRAAPDDDLPRLIFADYLEEQGHPALAARAAFIRLQIEAEKHPPGSEMWTELCRQMYGLRPQFRDEWAITFTLEELSGCTINYRRGFVDEVELGLGKLINLGERMFAAAPIRALRIADYDLSENPIIEWGEFERRGLLQNIRRLRFGPHLRSTGCAMILNLMAQKHLAALHHLDVANNDLDDNWLIPFVRRIQQAELATLKELDLSWNQLTDRSAHTLTASTWPEQLQRLELTGNRFTAEGIALLRRRFGGAVVV